MLVGRHSAQSKHPTYISLCWQSRITLSGGSRSDLLDPKVQPRLRKQL